MEKQKQTAKPKLFVELNNVYTNVSQIEAIELSLTTNSILGSNPLPHELYKRTFNYIDLLDRKWYSVNESHLHNNWRIKMLISVLRIMTYSCYVLDSHKTLERWKVWRIRTAVDLLHCYETSGKPPKKKPKK